MDASTIKKLDKETHLILDDVGGGKDGRLEGWKEGRGKGGRLEGWEEGREEGWKIGRGRLGFTGFWEVSRGDPEFHFGFDNPLPKLL